MRFSSPRERRLWRCAGVVLLTIYATLYPAQFVLDFLRARNLLRLTVSVLLATVAAALALAVLRRSTGWRELVVLSVALAVYLLIFRNIAIVQERTHFVVYGVVGGLVYAAIEERSLNGAAPRLAAYRGAPAAVA